MNCTVKIANVYNNILKETTPELVICTNNKTYIGKLFNEMLNGAEEVQEVKEQFIYEGDVKGLIIKTYELLKRHNMIAKDGKTFLTMAHWQLVNGLTNESLYDLGIYKYNTDTELFKANGIEI